LAVFPTVFSFTIAEVVMLFLLIFAQKVMHARVGLAEVWKMYFGKKRQVGKLYQ
jgi:hypothetical protein